MRIYIVRPGDSLYAVARRFGVSVDTLVYNNQIVYPARLAVGQTLVIPDGASGGTLGEMEVNGFAYPGINDAVLEEYLPFLTYLTPFAWVADAQGNITPPETSGSSAATQAAWPSDVRCNMKPEGGFSSDIAHAILPTL